MNYKFNFIFKIYLNVFQEEDKEEMKETLELKQTHDRLVKKRLEKLALMANPDTKDPNLTNDSTFM